MLLQLGNFLKGRLAAPVAAGDTQITLASATFPTLLVDHVFYAVLQSASDRSKKEIVKVVAVAGATITVERAQEGTTALSFAANDLCEQRLTAAQFQYVVDHSNDAAAHVPAGVAGKFLKGVAGGAPVWGMPTPADVGALPISGGNLTGPLGVQAINGLGSSGACGSMDIGGAKGSYAGFNFTAIGYWFGVRNDGLTGVWNSAGTPKWYFTENGVLAGGATVPWAIVTNHPSRNNWADTGVINVVAGQLAWKNYGNGHTIFDASAGTSPDGTAVDSTTPQSMYGAASGVKYPTLMGWNGANTYGVRVDSARISDASTTADRLTGVVGTNGQDLTIHGKRAMVGVYDSNQLIINYANDWGSTAIQGDLYAGVVQSSRHVAIHNGSTVYSNSGLEIRSTDGSSVRIGFHSSGHYAGSINFNSWGFQFEREAGGGSRANVAAANFFADAAQDMSGNALTRLDYVDGNFIKRRTRLHPDDGTSLDNVQKEHGFNYSTGGGIFGPYISFGGLGGNYECQINAAYSNSADLVFRTHNGDSGAWNPWRTIWNSGNFDPNSKLSNNGSGGTLYLSNWFRSTGASGWYNETYQGGVYMDEPTTVKIHNGKKFYTANAEYNAIGATGGIFSYQRFSVDTRAVVGNGGSFNAWRYADAPFHAGFGGLNVGSFAPIVGSANYTNGYGYTTRIHFGALTQNGGGWADAVIMVGSAENDAHPLAAYYFGADGHMRGLAALTLSGNANIGNDMICSYAYANGAQPQVAHALTRKDYVDSRDWYARWENKQVPNHSNGNANSHYESEWDGNAVSNAPNASWLFFREMYHSGGANWRHQEAFDFFANEEYFRRGIDGSGYDVWVRRWNSSNFNPDSKASLTGASFSGDVSAPTFNGLAPSYAAGINTLASRDGAGDLTVRLLRSEYGDQTPISGALAFRVSASGDNYLRFCSAPGSVRAWLQVAGTKSANQTTLYTGSSSSHPSGNAIPLSVPISNFAAVRFEFVNSGATIAACVTFSYDEWAALCASGKLMHIAVGSYTYTFENATIGASSLARNTSGNCYLTKIVGII